MPLRSQIRFSHLIFCYLFHQTFYSGLKAQNAITREIYFLYFYVFWCGVVLSALFQGFQFLLYFPKCSSVWSVFGYNVVLHFRAPFQSSYCKKNMLSHLPPVVFSQGKERFDFMCRISQNWRKKQTNNKSPQSLEKCGKLMYFLWLHP